MVSPTQLSVIRMIPLAHRMSRAGAGRLGVYRLLNSYRGWDSTQTPVMDARWALGQLRDRYGDDVPVCLVGHSLGGRAALLAGDAPTVRSVVALNAWVYPSDEASLRGRKVLFVHGSQDRIAPPDRAAQLAQRLSRTTPTRFLRIEGGKHAMLRHGAQFERAATEFAVSTLHGTD